MSEDKIQEHCEKIALYLKCEGLSFENFTMKEANELLDKTCLPTALKRHLRDYKEIVLEVLK